jgi:hypothetical protein
VSNPKMLTKTGEKRWILPLRLERFYSFSQSLLTFLHGAVKADARMLNVGTHEQTVRAHLRNPLVGT